MVVVMFLFVDFNCLVFFLRVVGYFVNRVETAVWMAFVARFSGAFFLSLNLFILFVLVNFFGVVRMVLSVYRSLFLVVLFEMKFVF